VASLAAAVAGTLVMVAWKPPERVTSPGDSALPRVEGNDM
jgi:hypothetical protein